MASVNWAAEALANIELIRRYIAQFDPGAADRMADRLFRAGESLADFPERGRPASRRHRELAIVPPYVIRYRVEGDEVFITGIRHGRQHPD